MRKKLSILLIASLVLSLMASCSKKPTTNVNGSDEKSISETQVPETKKEQPKSKSNDEDIVNSGYDVLDYCSTDSEVLEVLDKVVVPKEPENIGKLVMPKLDVVTISIIPLKEITKEDVDTEIQTRVESSKETLIPNRKNVENGDIVNIDFVGSVNGVEFQGGSATGQELEIGSHTFIEGFEEQLIGKELGTTFDIYVTFPKEYGAPELAGKKAKFKITLNEIKVPKAYKYDEEFIKKDSKGKCSTKEEYEKYIKEELEKRNIIQYNESKKALLEQKLVEISTLSATKKALAYAFASQIASDKKIAMQYGTDLANMLTSYGMTAVQYVEMIKTMTAQNLTSKAILKELAKQFDISDSFTDEEKKEWFNNIVDMYGYNQADITYEKLVEQAGEDVVNQDILRSKVLDEAIKHIIVIVEEQNEGIN